jgi:dipeptidyl aminopeptidase/acylaminoacyl peptidase
MTAIRYPARDGTEIPGYLSLPRGAPTKNLPLIVMPHGGPIARDTWGWFFLRQFLTSRGYAVLQMNFRGSGGYSDDWFFSAHQDWGGLTYDDVVDGTRWAIGQGIADPSRVCIVGWSFGGYLALVGAQRNSDLFRCSISIAGVSDLGMLIDEHYYYGSFKIVERQIGTDRDKLRRDSPRLHPADFKSPVLLIHGSLDANVPPEHSKEMDAALAAARKPHRLVMIAEADHSMTGEGFRTTLLREVETFLHQNLSTPNPTQP